jgi:hypothetical protein
VKSETAAPTSNGAAEAVWAAAAEATATEARTATSAEALERRTCVRLILVLAKDNRRRTLTIVLLPLCPHAALPPPVTQVTDESRASIQERA